jgi:hypothetical protein
LVDAVDHAFCEAGVDCMDFQDLEQAIEDEEYEVGTLAVLADGTRIVFDENDWTVEAV